jgi:hydroxymethylbilane synthase
MRHVLLAEVMCPAAGQGALAIEIRAGDFATAELVKFLDDRAARLTTNCERALLSKLGGGCQVPIGALAKLRGDRLHLDAIVASPDGGQLLRESREGDDPMSLGEETGEALLRRGGAQILEEVYGHTVAQPQQP